MPDRHLAPAKRVLIRQRAHGRDHENDGECGGGGGDGEAAIGVMDMEFWQGYRGARALYGHRSGLWMEGGRTLGWKYYACEDGDEGCAIAFRLKH